jgi:hypothetical protein
VEAGQVKQPSQVPADLRPLPQESQGELVSLGLFGAHQPA